MSTEQNNVGKLILSGCDKHLCRLRNIFILVVKATTLRWKRKGIIEVCHFNNDARVYFLIKAVMNTDLQCNYHLYYCYCQLQVFLMFA